MNLRQALFVLSVALGVTAAIVIVCLLLFTTQSPDPLITEAAARECLTQVVGNCIIK